MIYFDFVAIICCFSFPVSVFYLLILLDKEQELPNWGHGIGIGVLALFVTAGILANSNVSSTESKCLVIHMDNNSYTYIPDLKKFLNLNESTKENWGGEEFAWVTVSNRISDNGIVIYSKRNIEVKRLTQDEKKIYNDKTTN